MPYMRVDPDAFAEMASELGDDVAGEPTGEFEYESAEAQFKAAKLSPVGRVLLDSLRAAGATAFKVRYDGGYDEGFSHPEALRFGEDGEYPIADAIPKLVAPALVAALRTAAGEKSMWGNAQEMYRKASDHEVLKYALDELAQDLASRLLGDGYGTGEYSLYGAFTADLASGQITDHEDVERPPDLMT
jgi:hypothetical protein